jgi:hypothetical protein
MLHFEEQINWYTQYTPKIDELNNHYHSKFNASKNHDDFPDQIIHIVNDDNSRQKQCVPHTCHYCQKHTYNTTIDKYINFPSLHRQYVNECTHERNLFIEYYKKHKEYFHHNVFEELMMSVWHPRNISRFCDLE